MAVPGQLETEQGFGTGLRRQLERRRDGEVEAPQTEPDVAAAVPSPPPPAPERPQIDQPTFVAYDDGEAEGLRSELVAALGRESSLRDQLAELQDTLVRESATAESMSLRSAEVDARAAKLAAAGPSSTSGSASS